MALKDDLYTIRKALYAGQISAAKVDAQRAFDRLTVAIVDEHARGWAEGARAAVDGFTECSRVDCGKPARHFYINTNYCDEHEPDSSGPAHRT